MDVRKNGNAAKDPPKDIIQNIIGSFGKYQLYLCILIFLTKYSMAFHQMGIIFLAPKVSYICPDTGNQTCPCDDPVYDRSVFTNTIVMEWNLICGRQWLVSLTQTLFQLGSLFGSALFGVASDKFGRKYTFLLALFVQMSSGIANGYMPTYWSFTVLRFLVGVGVGGTMVTGFVILMEFAGIQYRDSISAWFSLHYDFGYIIMPGLAYVFRDYAQFQLATSLPMVVFISYVFLLPETPRWLIAAKKTEEAVLILERVARVNNRPTENIRATVEAYEKTLGQTKLRKGNVLDLVRTPALRRNTVCMAFCFFSCSYCVFGVSQYVGQLGGNVFVNVAASATVAAIGAILSMPLMKITGRKTIFVSLFLVCGASLLLLAVSDGGIAVAFACIGLGTGMIIFLVASLYCSEMYPTVVRNAAVGVFTMLSRVGSMVAPFVIGLQARGAWVPAVVFAAPPLAAALVALLLPETKGCQLMTTVEEGEQFAKRKGSAKL
ncbi:unnamed protein product [Plutella xylostella]|uniref:(diamondback moth) hypothetical protein n=1 Tax=Plutella xylostella TaxID=51655 RepID=A0A8S4FVL7_PLUXY|nr:unnamed protein product [Plutella xylostella]